MGIKPEEKPTIYVIHREYGEGKIIDICDWLYEKRLFYIEFSGAYRKWIFEDKVKIKKGLRGLRGKEGVIDEYKGF